VVSRRGTSDEMLMTPSVTLPACGLLVGVAAARYGQTRQVAPSSRDGMCLGRAESAVDSPLPLHADLSGLDEVGKWGW
jgi:hypothetical protein